MNVACTEGERLALSEAQKQLNEEDTDGPDQTAGTRARAKARAEKKAQKEAEDAADAAKGSAALAPELSQPPPADEAGTSAGKSAAQDEPKKSVEQNSTTEGSEDIAAANAVAENQAPGLEVRV